MKKGEREFNFSIIHKGFYITIGLIILIGMGAFVHAITAPNPGHTANQIYINYGTLSNPCYVNLQKASTSYYLSKDSSTLSPTCETIPKDQPYALASEVMVTVGTQKMTLQQAVQSNSIWGTVRNLPGGLSFTTSLPVYESASNINLTLPSGSILTLQSAINNKGFTCTPKTKSQACGSFTCGSASDGCGGSISCGLCTAANTQCSSSSGGTCISSCSSNMGNSCTPPGLSPDCISQYKIQCDGTSCSGGTYKTQGTSCGIDDSGNAVDSTTNSCDGSGHCNGWSGTGCGSCKFGVSTVDGGGFGNTWSYCNLNGNQGRWNAMGLGGHYWSSWSYSSAPACSQVDKFFWIVTGSYSYPWQIKP